MDLSIMQKRLIFDSSLLDSNIYVPFYYAEITIS